MKKYIILLGVVAVLAFIITTPASETDKFEFSHKLHVVEQELVCADCHAQAEQSMSGQDNLMPAKTVCLDCHAEEEIGNFELISRVETYSVKFSHKLHLASGENCESCHSAVAHKEEAFPYVLPSMVECMSCHQSKAVSNTCSTCHLPFENLQPASHTPNFSHNHGDQARMGAKEMSADMACVVCHDTQFCQDCHEGENLDRFSHPLNYQFTHALDAKNQERECAVCHTERSFCVSCHRDNNVLPQSHTVGWVNNFPNDGGRHRVEALNDLEACIACHEQNAEQICQPCHGN